MGIPDEQGKNKAITGQWSAALFRFLLHAALAG